MTGPVRKVGWRRRFLNFVRGGVERGSLGHVVPTRVPHVGAPVDPTDHAR